MRAPHVCIVLPPLLMVVCRLQVTAGRALEEKIIRGWIDAAGFA
jgi:hypothetical protein